MSYRSQFRFIAQNSRRSIWERKFGLGQPGLSRLINALGGRSVPLYWARDPRATNFGDELTALLIPALTGLAVHWSPLDRRCLIGAGSVLGWLDREPTKKPRVIWGAGLMHEESTALLPNDLIVSVRGQLTLERIVGKSSAHTSLDSVGLGDPGLVTSLAFAHTKPADPSSILFIPHLVDRNSMELRQLLSSVPESKVLDVTRDPRALCAEISQARMVLSSALHPLIVADSYGIPNARIILSDRIHGGDFKFRDYYSVFDAPPSTPSLDVNSLVRSFDLQIAEIVKHYERPGIERVVTCLSESLSHALQLVSA